MRTSISPVLAALVLAPQAFAAAPAIPPAVVNPPILFRQVTGLNMTCIGDSTCWYGNFAIPAGSTYPYNNTVYQTGSAANSYIGWLAALSGNAFVYDPLAFGYPGSWGGLLYVIPLTGGTCPANTTLTVQPSTPTGTPANQASSFTVSTDGNGAITGLGQKIFPSSQGSGYVANPTFTITPSCSIAPTWTWALTGVGSYGSPGDTSAGVLIRAQLDVCPAQPDIVIVVIGTNDVNQSVPYSTIIGNIQATVETLRACGIQRVVLAPIPPRNNGTGGWSQAKDQVRIRVNRWMQAFAQQSRLASGGYSSVIAFDVDHLWTDASSSNGNPLASKTVDGLHPSPDGARDWAIAALNVMKSWASPSAYTPNSYSDFYSATNNPAGNLEQASGTPWGLFYSSGGSASGGCTTSSGVGNAWLVGGSFTGTPSCVATLENPRSDGLSGNRQQVVTSNTNGGTNDQFSISIFNNFSSNLALGTDSIHGTVDIDSSNSQYTEEIGAAIQETATPYSQYSMCLFATYYGPSYPLSPSSRLAQLVEARNLPDFGMTGSGSYRVTCHLPKIVTQATATAYTFVVRAHGDSSAGKSWTQTVKVGNVAVRKMFP